MPGIADLQPVQVQANSLAAVDQPITQLSQPTRTPEFDDFMNAYRQGVITAEDIKKRQIVGTTGYEAEKARNIEATAGSKQNLLDINEVRPMQRELAKTQTVGAQEQATLLNQMNSSDPSIRIPAQEAFHKRQDQLAAIQVFGTATPKISVSADVKPPPFEEWVSAQVNKLYPGDLSQEAADRRAVEQTRLITAGEKGVEYQTAVKEAKGRTMELTPGTPEYDSELARRVDEAMTLTQHRQVQMAALMEFSKAQGKAAGEGPGKAQEQALQLGAKESEIRKEIASLDPIKELDKARPQYQQILLDEQKVNSRTDEEWRKDPQAARALDLHLAFNYFKILHPDTRVTESNFKELQHLSPVDVGTEEISDYMNKLLRGAYLDPTGRRRILEEGKRAYQGYINTAKPILEGYRTHAARTGTDPDAITHPWAHVFEETPVTNPNAPLPGSTAPAGLPRPTVDQKSNAPTFTAPGQVPNTVQFFKDPDGVLRVNPNFRP